MLVKAVLDYIPEVNDYGPVDGSSIGLSGFYSVMTALRNTLLYHAEGELLQLRKNLIKGAKVNMVEFLDHEPTKLSGGQKQRVSIAGVIAMHPKCIILDEPTAMLDPKGRKEVIRAVRALNDVEKITIILITHYMETFIG